MSFLKPYAVFYNQIGETVLGLANSVDAYYQSGVIHHQKGIGFSTALGEVAKAFQHDDKISEPIIKVSSFYKESRVSGDVVWVIFRTVFWKCSFYAAVLKFYNSVLYALFYEFGKC